MKKKHTQVCYFALCILAMLLVLLDSKNAINGAKDGIILCIYTVIPTLFPFCVLSIVFRSMVAGSKLRFMQQFEYYCYLPAGCGIIFLLGLIGGYPIGAICIEKAIKDKRLSKDNVKYLRGLCNNAGPSFIIGMLSPLFIQKKLPFVLILILAISALFSNLLLTEYTPETIKNVPNSSIKLSEAIKQATECMLNVCATIILFKTFLHLIQTHLFLPKEIWTIIAGLTELTNGITLLPSLSQEHIMFVTAAMMLSFGGLCVFMQTMTFSTPNTAKYYLIAKMMQTAISGLLAILYIKINSIIIFISMSFIVFNCVRFIKYRIRSIHKYCLKNSGNSINDAV